MQSNAPTKDEDQAAASVLSELLTSAMTRAYQETPPRTWLYGWERDGYRWLIRFWERRPDGTMCAWSGSFLRLNRDAILSGDGRIDFNLRAAREKIEAKHAE